MKNRSIALAILALGFLAFATAMWMNSRPGQLDEPVVLSTVQDDALSRTYSPILGEVSAPVTIVEFFDPACEACRAFHPIVKDILSKNAGKVRVAMRYTPFHGEGSIEAIRVLEAARMQGVFEQVLEALLAEQPRWASHGAPAPGLIMQIAAAAGLDSTKAKTQMLAPSVIAIINQERADIETLGVNKTPTFYIDGQIVDALNEEKLRAVVSKAVASIKE